MAPTGDSGLPPLLDPAVRRVLLVRLRVGLGDLLCTAPAIRALHAARPDLQIALATWPEMRPVLERLPGDLELVVFPGVDGIPERPPDGTIDQWYDEVRARRFDLALQMYGDNPAANTVTASTGARLVGGFAPTGMPVPDSLHMPYPHRLSEVERHLALFEHLGLPPGADRSLAFPLRESDAPRVALAPGSFVVLHPGATSSSRRWPAARFAEVGDALAARGFRVVVGGVSSEGGTTAEVVRRMRAPVLDVTGRTTLGEYAVLLRDAGVVVANDTGTAHLTVAVGGRVVTVFLSGDPVRWAHPAPPQGGGQVVVVADVGCNPCSFLDCPVDWRCATRITPAQVTAAALDLLARHPVKAAHAD